MLHYVQGLSSQRVLVPLSLPLPVKDTQQHMSGHSEGHGDVFKLIWLPTMWANKLDDISKGGIRIKKISHTYLKIKKVHKQEGWIGLLKVKKSMKTRKIGCGPLF